jgi:hypothetical protein
MNEGRHDGNAKGVDLDVPHAGGVPVVVRDRESLSHGEGEQFELLGSANYRTKRGEDL